MRSLRLLAFALLGSLLLGKSAAQPPEAANQPRALDFYHDFRGKPLPAGLLPFQVEEDEFLRFEPEGLRVTLPRGYRHPVNGVGCRISSVFRGDYEVTATVAFIDVERPPSGNGAGVGLSVDSADSGVQMRRVVGPKGRHTLLSAWYFTVPDKDNLQWKQQYTPCPDTLLRMRLTRTGRTVRCLWSPGAAGDDFQELHQFESGQDDVEHVRLFAFNNQNPCKVDVRLIDLRIRSGEAVPESEQRPAKGWLRLALVLILSLVIASLIVVWIALRQGRRAGLTQQE